MSSVDSKMKPARTGAWIVAGLLAGVLCGLLFGEYCAPLQWLGQGYVGLLQMTVLPYLAISLIANLGRLDPQQARRLGVAVVAVLLVLWAVGIVLVVAVSAVLPPIEGASFFDGSQKVASVSSGDFLSQFIPTNIFRSLSEEYVPAVVVFCLFFGIAVIKAPGKERLLEFLDVCADGMARINVFLVRLAPIGLFMLTAAAAGTLRLDEFARLQAYLIIFALACFVAAFLAIPLLVSSVTDVRYRDFVQSAYEPLLTALATGKLFVVLPQIIDKCEGLVGKEDSSEGGQSPARVVAPLAYPTPHIGKILGFVFISFAAWYVGRELTPGQTTAMAAMGAVSSFASPLVTIPYLLDRNHLPQDLMTLFILPGFITMRLADIVGVMHLMGLTVIVSRALQGRMQIRWRRLSSAALVVLAGLALGGAAGRWYLASCSLDYDLDDRLLSMAVPNPYADVVVYASREEASHAPTGQGSTLERIKDEGVLRVGYNPDHLPYSFLNRSGDLVGMDVELMHRLAERLDVRLEFVPYAKNTVVEQLESGEIDVAVGGLIINPERLLQVGFTQPYQTATVAVVLRDHRRREFAAWHDPNRPADLRLGVVGEDVAAVARRELPDVDFVVIDSIRNFFENPAQLDGLIVAAEEGAAWNVLYPDYAVVVPQPVIQRPVGMAVRLADAEWRGFLDRWLDFERFGGSLDRLRSYWIEGGGTQETAHRWSVLHDVLHWLP